MSEALMIQKALIYSIYLTRGKLFIIQCGEVIFPWVNCLISKNSVFFTKNIHGGEKVECVLGRTLCLKNKIELPITWNRVWWVDFRKTMLLTL